MPSRRHFLTLLSLAAAGCSSGSAPQNSGADVPAPGPSGSTATTAAKKKIGFSALTLANPFFRIIADAMTAEAAKLGYEVVLVDGEQDVRAAEHHGLTAGAVVVHRCAPACRRDVGRSALGPCAAVVGPSVVAYAVGVAAAEQHAMPARHVVAQARCAASCRRGGGRGCDLRPVDSVVFPSLVEV